MAEWSDGKPAFGGVGCRTSRFEAAWRRLGLYVYVEKGPTRPPRYPIPTATACRKEHAEKAGGGSDAGTRSIPRGV